VYPLKRTVLILGSATGTGRHGAGHTGGSATGTVPAATRYRTISTRMRLPAPPSPRRSLYPSRQHSAAQGPTKIHVAVIFRLNS